MSDQSHSISHPSLPGMHGTVEVPGALAGFWKQWRAYVGPALLISVGYMDPGNWGSDLSAGAKYKYGLLWVVGVASLMASGQSSTITGTLAGQVVMEGFMHWRISPAVRRLITRAMAITPAVLIIKIRGNSSVNDLLNLSQVVLALQLPLAMLPLLHFTSSSKRMGQWRSGRFLLVAGWGSAILITIMDVIGLPDSLKQAWHVIVGG